MTKIEELVSLLDDLRRVLDYLKSHSSDDVIGLGERLSLEEQIKKLKIEAERLKKSTGGKAFPPGPAFNSAAPFIVNAALEALPELRAVVEAERRLREKRREVDEAIAGLGGGS